MKKSIKDIKKFINLDTNRAYCLDTNILYWYFYPRANFNNTKEKEEIYYNFVDTLISDGNPICITSMNLTELINIIEKNEYDLYCKTHPNVSKKEFRNIESERKRVKNIIKASVSSVYSNCKIYSVNITVDKVNEFVEKFNGNTTDIFDYISVEELKKMGNSYFVSDDQDLASIDGITLFTANKKVLS